MLWALLVAGGAAFVLISVKDEIRLGRETQATVRRQTPRVTEPEVASYVREIGRRLTARAGGPEYPYSFDVANYSDLNAFALPGGPVWIHRGALQAARSESELAGVLAHEIAHIAQRHAAEQISGQVVANLGIGLLSALLGNTGGAVTTQAAAELLTGGMFLKFSRDDERDADRVGAQIMARAGWDPRGLLGFMEVLRVAQRRDPSSVDVFFSTHPAPDDRIMRLRTEIASLPRGRRNTGRFDAIKRRLAQLPRAKARPRR